MEKTPVPSFPVPKVIPIIPSSPSNSPLSIDTYRAGVSYKIVGDFSRYLGNFLELHAVHNPKTGILTFGSQDEDKRQKKLTLFQELVDKINKGEVEPKNLPSDFPVPRHNYTRVSFHQPHAVGFQKVIYNIPLPRVGMKVDITNLDNQETSHYVVIKTMYNSNTGFLDHIIVKEEGTEKTLSLVIINGHWGIQQHVIHTKVFFNPS